MDFKFIDIAFLNKYVRVKDKNITLSCETNNENATVTLEHPLNATFGNRLRRVGQRFVLTEVELNDTGIYSCIATNGTVEIKMELGILYVREGEIIFIIVKVLTVSL